MLSEHKDTIIAALYALRASDGKWMAGNQIERIDAALAALEAGQESPGQPDWSKAEPWAQWLAKDCTGGWFWHEYEPEIWHNEGWRNRGRTQLAQMAGDGWLESKCQRPQEGK